MEINSTNTTINETEENTLRCIVFNPEKDYGDIVDISLLKEANNENNEENKLSSFDNDVYELIGLDKNSELKPVVYNLQAPLHDFIFIFHPYMTSDDNLKYNFAYTGFPLFGNIILFEIKLDSDQTEATDNTQVMKFVSMDENTAKCLVTFFHSNRKLEEDSGVRNSILEDIEKFGKKQYLHNLMVQNEMARIEELKNAENNSSINDVTVIEKNDTEEN